MLGPTLAATVTAAHASGAAPASVVFNTTNKGRRSRDLRARGGRWLRRHRRRRPNVEVEKAGGTLTLCPNASLGPPFGQ